MNKGKIAIQVFLVLTMSWSYDALAGNVKKDIEAPVHEAVGIEQTTQAREVNWRTEKEKKTLEFEAMEKEMAMVEKERNTEADRRTALISNVSRKTEQIEDIAEIEGQISPFLCDLLDKIKKLNARDLPFLQEERRKRIQALEELNANPQVPVSEKFRKLMEALLVETEYGTTIEVYQQTVSLSGEETLVNIFRLGRLRLFYQTLDKQQCGFFNPAQKVWEPLENIHIKTIQAAIDMGLKRKPVEILSLPLGRIVVQ
ncbi:DUF3450 domain-containing protein [Desulfobacter hydrogenophilus]|uniref:DUF3450 domain-containing protein n=1 Tax=Desulfobacter hydrogenophilus TaxID=2291 RepID=A0A328FAQ2_9BACT|nr:DUF3450 domain-containing protein [Desulfobacter hydrogenophilus]NDY73755.1 DUF3450 domain-containing protein [Desulfobacter hydrogenophilus]QBH13384.1 DUF3450 domain-containing protein [Desulfobacter hydrogenophilus]RAM00492.1 DUF3450 domain-containing protein [Desulfobacter hydrogenophilus]